MPPISSPVRRVLGEKDANASLNITSPRKAQKTDFNSRPGAKAEVHSKALSGAVMAVSRSPRLGQKRRINEVDGVDVQDWEEVVPASQMTDLVSDSASEAEGLDTSMFSARSAADTTMTSFGVGPSQENLVEQQFELLEPEMSQKTLEKMHAVSLPQNTSQPSQLRDRPNLIQNTSQDSVGMSNFVNFHSDPSSQGSDGLRLIDSTLLESQARDAVAESARVAEVELNEEDKRKSLMEEKAEQLRTRLQLAFFKVETRQTNTPLSRLKIPESHRRKSASPPSLPPIPSSLHKPSYPASAPPPHERTGLSPEARIAALRAQATMQRKSAVRALSSLPMPNIRPTAFSARWADERRDGPSNHHFNTAPPPTSSRSDGQNDQSVLIPSSPPISNHSLRIHEDETATTTAVVASQSRAHSTTDLESSPLLPTPKTPAVQSNTDGQLSSPPPSQGEDEVDDHLRSDAEPEPTASRTKEESQTDQRRLSGSIVKDEAASGLLQLMRSGMVNASNVRGPMCGL